MSTRLTSALIALVVVTSIVATEENLDLPTCTDVCCKNAELAPAINWQATECKLATHCLDKCPYKFCCTDYDTVDGVAANCTEATGTSYV